ncbi:MAG: DUF4830 domain-containing protein, partial [Ruminococcus sp.]|nr:DUF4830 domain-containing protein [Candidatus Copronaster equi]
MFVFSFKSKRMVAFIAIWLVAVIALIMVFVASTKKKSVIDDSSINYSASNASERTTFLSQFGWSIEEDPIEVSEIIIPEEFNDTYKAYNELQKKQNLNLEPYKGVRAKKWVYSVKNYPDASQQSNDIQATIIVYDNLV